MKLINENVWKFDSVKYGAYMALFLSCVHLILQEVYNANVLPEPYQSIASIILVFLATYVGRKKAQPELHPDPTVLGFANLPVDSITFEKAFQRLIGHEGGYTNDKRDPGNWTGGKVGVGVLKGTKYGIAANTYPNLDIKNLSLAQAKEIYKKDWWDKLGGNGIHSAITFQLWDFAINAGRKRAIQELQQAVGVTADGIIGPKTIEAVNTQDLNDVILTLTAERLKFYTSLNTWPTWGKGWTNRVADNLKYAAQDN